MRLFLAAAMTAAILGIVQAYFSFAEFAKPPAVGPVEIQQATGSYSLRITATCTAEADAFGDGHAVEVTVNGTNCYRSADSHTAEQPLELKELAAVRVGDNHFFLHWQPAGEAASRPNAIRVEVFRDAELVSEQTLWSEAGTPLGGTVHLQVPAVDQTGPTHDH